MGTSPLLEGKYISSRDETTEGDDRLTETPAVAPAESFRIRKDLLGSGRLYLERKLPFLMVYRRPAERPDPGCDELITSQAAYVIGDDSIRLRHQTIDTVRSVCTQIQPDFGAFLIIEIWSRPPEHPPVNDIGDTTAPGFRLFAAPSGGLAGPLLEVLARHLESITIGQIQAAVVTQEQGSKGFPGKPKPFFKKAEAKDLSCVQLGIEVEPVFQQDGTGVFPNVLKILRRKIGYALQHCIFQFAEHQTKMRPKNFHSLGRRVLVKSVWSADERLHNVASGFDFLREINPVNIEWVWREFKRSGYEMMPSFRYRPLSIDPGMAKRALFSIPLERIEDPTILYLFQQHQTELDRKLTMLSDRGTSRFLLGSRQLYGNIPPSLVRAAETILEKLPSHARELTGHRLPPQSLARMAEMEIAHYQNLSSEVAAPVLIRPDVIAGLMVSNGRLLISDTARMPILQAEALIQHEVGTHLVTYFNGRAQKLAQLSSGFADYEQLQEGLAVLAEFLVGGLTPGRMRTLAARVLGAKVLIDGGTFVDCFRLLSRLGFVRRNAFNITVRLFRGGGLTKDYIYLRGLNDVLKYLREGGELEPLYVGKIATKQLPIVAELMSRKVILPPKVMPRYLEREDCRARLNDLRQGVAVHELLNIDTE